MPEILLNWALDLRQAVLLVVPTQYAAQMLVESFVDLRHWDHCRLQLRTGAHKSDEFHQDYTPLSIVTYGMLWKWLTSEAEDYKWMLRRYKCFLLDEFARVQPSETDDGLLQPQIEECASILTKIVKWSGDRKRLVVTSAALQEKHLKQCFGEAAGFLAVATRRFSLYRFVAAPTELKHLLESCAQLVETSAWERNRLFAWLERDY